MLTSVLYFLKIKNCYPLYSFSSAAIGKLCDASVQTSSSDVSQVRKFQITSPTLIYFYFSSVM